MNHHSYFLSQTLLQYTQMRSFSMFCCQCFHFFLTQRSENLYITCGILVTYIQPELIELVRRSITGVQPNITRLSLTELTTIGLCNQRTSQCKHFTAISTANQLGPGSNITPLIRTTHLKFAALCFIKMQEIVSLQQLVSKFCK